MTILHRRALFGAAAGLATAWAAPRAALAQAQPPAGPHRLPDLPYAFDANEAAVDARTMEYFEGDTRHPAAKVAGTIKGAVNLEHTAWFPSGTSVFATPAQAQKVVASSAPLSPQKETVTFCNTGHLSATYWFALSEVLGQKSVKMYAGSMVDWTQDTANLPMDNVPSRAKQLIMDARMALSR
jgi:3-mercaptopyruvate sulfurtransferase SseA